LSLARLGAVLFDAPNRDRLVANVDRLLHLPAVRVLHGRLDWLPVRKHETAAASEVAVGRGADILDDDRFWQDQALDAVGVARHDVFRPLQLHRDSLATSDLSLGHRLALDIDLSIAEFGHPGFLKNRRDEDSALDLIVCLDRFAIATKREN